MANIERIVRHVSKSGITVEDIAATNAGLKELFGTAGFKVKAHSTAPLVHLAIYERGIDEEDRVQIVHTNVVGRDLEHNYVHDKSTFCILGAEGADPREVSGMVFGYYHALGYTVPDSKCSD